MGDGCEEVLTRCENIRKELVGHISIFILSLSFKSVNLVHICWSATITNSESNAEQTHPGNTDGTQRSRMDRRDRGGHTVRFVITSIDMNSVGPHPLQSEGGKSDLDYSSARSTSVARKRTRP